MAYSIKGERIKDTSDGGKTVEPGTKTHREAVAAARKQADRSSRGASSVGYPDTPEVARAFDSLRSRSRKKKDSQETQKAADDAANEAADAAEED